MEMTREGWPLEGVGADPDDSSWKTAGQPGDLAPMAPIVPKWFDLPRLLHHYKRRMPLILVNGLAEQSESWFANRTYLTRHFDVKVPEILVYDGESLHQWINSGGAVTVEYLADRLGRFLDEFVQRPPYHLVGSSLG